MKSIFHKKNLLLDSTAPPYWRLINKPVRLVSVANPGDAVWGNFPPKHLWRPVEWRAFVVNALLFGAYRNRNRDKKYS